MLCNVLLLQYFPEKNQYKVESIKPGWKLTVDLAYNDDEGLLLSIASCECQVMDSKQDTQWFCMDLNAW